jgi:general stress protein CsbA
MASAIENREQLKLEDREQSKKETGASLMFIGLAIWVADALVLFFLPASVKMGGGRFTWLTAITVLALMGLTLLVAGYVMRGKAEE